MLKPRVGEHMACFNSCKDRMAGAWISQEVMASVKVGELGRSHIMLTSLSAPDKFYSSLKILLKPYSLMPSLNLPRPSPE